MSSSDSYALQSVRLDSSHLPAWNVRVGSPLQFHTDPEKNHIPPCLPQTELGLSPFQTHSQLSGPLVLLVLPCVGAQGLGLLGQPESMDSLSHFPDL